MVGSESVLGGVEDVMGFPGVADAVCQYASSKFSGYFKQADGSKVFNAGEFIGFGEWDKPPLFPVVRDVLCWP